MMGLNGMSAVLAALGGLLFILIIVGSVLFGKRTGDKPLEGLVMTTATKYGSAEHPKIPGTVVLVAVFFVSFVLYYFVNWKYLAEVWPLR
jgi:cytochrome c oxidase subunit 1